MTLYELISPGDPYVFEAVDDDVASVAAAALNDAFFAASSQGKVVPHPGGELFSKVIAGRPKEVADALDSMKPTGEKGSQSAVAEAAQQIAKRLREGVGVEPPPTGGFLDPVPDHLRRELVRFIQRGMIPEHFLRALIANDLEKAIAAAASETVADLEALAKFLKKSAPAVSYGSEKALDFWSSLAQADRDGMLKGVDWVFQSEDA
jgi:hypothetical protein